MSAESPDRKDRPSAPPNEPAVAPAGSEIPGQLPNEPLAPAAPEEQPVGPPDPTPAKPDYPDEDHPAARLAQFESQQGGSQPELPFSPADGQPAATGAEPSAPASDEASYVDQEAIAADLAAAGGSFADVLGPSVDEVEHAVDPFAHRARLQSILESLLFAADQPLTSADLAELVGEPERSVID